MKEIEIPGSWAVMNDDKAHFVPDWLLPVIDDIEQTYEFAITADYIRKPKAYALYEAWKKVDKEERSKRDAV